MPSNLLQVGLKAYSQQQPTDTIYAETTEATLPALPVEQQKTVTVEKSPIFTLGPFSIAIETTHTVVQTPVSVEKKAIASLEKLAKDMVAFNFKEILDSCQAYDTLEDKDDPYATIPDITFKETGSSLTQISPATKEDETIQQNAELMQANRQASLTAQQALFALTEQVAPILQNPTLIAASKQLRSLSAGIREYTTSKKNK